MMFGSLVKYLTNQIIASSTIIDKRFYTVIVERIHKPPIVRKGRDPRSRHLKSLHFQYKLVDTLHSKKWGNVDLILTEYVEGVGHKGELINVPRHDAYYHLLPARLAVYPTEEYLELFKKERESLSSKAKVSPFAMKTKEEIEKMTLEIPMNMSFDWTLKPDNIRIALRYQKIMCPNENITIPEGLDINSKNIENFKDPFVVQIKVNDYISANLKCIIKPVNLGKLWEEFTVFQKTV